MKYLTTILLSVSFFLGTAHAQSEDPLMISQGLVINSYYPQQLVKRVDKWFSSTFEKDQYKFNVNMDMGVISATVKIPFHSEHNDEEFFASGTITYKISLYMGSNKVVYVFTNFFHTADTSLYEPPEMDEEEKEEFTPPVPISFGVITYDEKCPIETMAKRRWNNKVWEELHMAIRREYQQRSYSISRIILNM